MSDILNAIALEVQTFVLLCMYGVTLNKDTKKNKDQIIYMIYKELFNTLLLLFTYFVCVLLLKINISKQIRTK